jgi:hypothetical protein
MAHIINGWPDCLKFKLVELLTHTSTCKIVVIITAGEEEDDKTICVLTFMLEGGT